MMEFCYNHPDKEAVARCNNCGMPICKTCRVYKGKIICPQCAGLVPSSSHNCYIHPERYANFTCYYCGKPLCNLDKLIVRGSTMSNSGRGVYYFKIWAGCPNHKRCELYIDYKNKKVNYKLKYKEYIKRYKKSRCTECGGKLAIKKIDPRFNFKRFYCKSCGKIYPLLSGIEEFEFLDRKLLKASSTNLELKSRTNSSNTMKCPSCGSEVPDYSNFCKICGEKLIIEEYKSS
ncbi:MAG: zinc-ribbon domain-containing protein [Promethearchaeota archaeon]|nr:MAG: zinc-ribbon domain-containing protein [Candidatus Lokiarchaeota archaeon]